MSIPPGRIHQDPDLAVEMFVLEPAEERIVGVHEQDLADEPATDVAGDGTAPESARIGELARSDPACS